MNDTIKKGSRVRITYLESIYIVDAVNRKKGQAYAVSESGMSGRWFDLADVVLA